MLEPDKLFRCIKGGQGTEGRAALKELGRIAEAIDALTEKRGRIFEAYAKEQMGAVNYIEAGRAIDEGIVRLRRQKDGLLSTSREAGQADAVSASVRQFCATARARSEACADLDAKRVFLRDHRRKDRIRSRQDHDFRLLPVQGAIPFSARG
jgi:hypothetical protein